jgi:hypothetical protein
MSDLNLALGIGVFAFVVQALLLLVVFRKAGFGIAYSVSAFFPLAALCIQFSMIFSGKITPSEGAILALPLNLLPFLMLAFKSWPIAMRYDTEPETIT